MMSAYDRKGGRGSSQGRTQLHKAARKGHIEAVKDELLRNRPTIVDDEGSTPLHDAAACDENAAEQVTLMWIPRS